MREGVEAEDCWFLHSVARPAGRSTVGPGISSHNSSITRGKPLVFSVAGRQLTPHLAGATSAPRVVWPRGAQPMEAHDSGKLPVVWQRPKLTPEGQRGCHIFMAKPTSMSNVYEHS